MPSISNPCLLPLRTDWSALSTTAITLRAAHNDECLQEVAKLDAECGRQLSHGLEAARNLRRMLDTCCQWSWLSEVCKSYLEAHSLRLQVTKLENVVRDPASVPAWKRLVERLLTEAAKPTRREEKPREKLERYKRMCAEQLAHSKRMADPLFSALSTFHRHLLTGEQNGLLAWKPGEREKLRQLLADTAADPSDVRSVLPVFEKWGRRLKKLKKAIPLYEQALERGIEAARTEKVRGRVAELARKNSEQLDEAWSARPNEEQTVRTPRDLVFAYLFCAREIGDSKTAGRYLERLQELPARVIVKTLDKLLEEQLIAPADKEQLQAVLSDQPDAEEPIAEQQRKLLERAEADQALLPFVPDDDLRRKLTLSVTGPSVADTRSLLAAALSSQELADELLTTNPSLFLLHQEQPAAFMEYAHRLEEITPALALLIRDRAYRPSDFASPAALERSIEAAYEEVAASEEKEAIKRTLAERGLEPEIAFAILHYGFYFSGRYFTNSSPIPEEHVRSNVRRRTGRPAEIESELHGQLAKLVREGGVIEYRQCYGLNAKVEGPLRKAVLWVLDHPPRSEKAGR